MRRGFRGALLALFVLLGLPAVVLAAAGGKPHRAPHGAKKGAAISLGAVVRVPVEVPPPPDYALAEIKLPLSRAAAVSVKTRGPHGADYIAAARFAGSGHLRILALVLNRPTPLMDPTTVRLLLNWHAPAHAAGSARGHSLARIARAGGEIRDGLGSRGEPQPDVCNLTGPGTPLTPEALIPLLSSGKPLAGFSAQQALAQAYDLSCGLSFEPAFEEAVRGGAGGEREPVPPPEPAPEPTPPICACPATGAGAAAATACPACPGPPTCPPCAPGADIACPMTPAQRPTMCAQPAPRPLG